MSTSDETLAARLLRATSKEGENQSNVAKLLSLLSSETTEKWCSEDQRKSRGEQLQKLHCSLKREEEFKPGDIVCWKAGLKNRKRPGYGEPAIVVEVLTIPVFEGTDDAGSPYFREPLSVVLGLLNDEDFIMFHYDGRRFELAPKVDAQAKNGGPMDTDSIPT